MMSKSGQSSNCHGASRKTCDEFLAELKTFHSSNKTPFYREPYLLGRKMDLLKLYNIVLSRGGFKKVTEERAWPLIVEDLRLGRRCVNASLAVKQVYQRYLETYERFHAHNEDGWPGGNVTGSTGAENEGEGESEVNTTSTKLRCGRYAPAPSECAVPMIYNENAHLIPPHMRQKWGLSTQLVDLKEYSLLEKSLHSGLPNEVDFSLNTTLLMSSQPSGLNLTSNRGLVDLLLAHVGVFDEGKGSYLMVEPYWRQQDDRNMLKYWYENIMDQDARMYLLPNVFSDAVIDDKKYLDKIESARSQLPLPIIYDLFNLRDDLTLPDTEGHRVFVVATALRNLALDEKCTRVLASHPQVIRFALLCGHARHAALRQLGQEMLALLRFPIKGLLAHYFTKILSECVNDVDRTTRLRGLEMIARQCQLVDNKNFLSNELPMDVYDAVISNLLVKDLHLVVNALEATYMLSTIGSDACERLISNIHCIPLLMSLLTIEAQAMGTDGLIRVKIMQGLNQTSIVPQTPVILGQQSVQGVRLVAGQSLMPPPNSLPRSGAGVVAANASTTPQARQAVATGSRSLARAPSPQIVQQQQPVSGSSYIPIAPKPALTAQPVINPPRNVQSTTTVSSPQSNVKQNLISTNTTVFHTSPMTSTPRKGSQGIRGTYVSAPDNQTNQHFVIRQYDHDPDAPTERREFTLYWLRKYYEPFSQASVSRVHIYTEFQRAYSKQFQQLTNITALEFHSCVKEAFPNVGQVKVQVPAGNVEIHYNHIKHVDDSPPSLQLPLTVTSSGTNLTLPQIVSKSSSSATKPLPQTTVQPPPPPPQKVATIPSIEMQPAAPKQVSAKPPEPLIQFSSHSKPETTIHATLNAVGVHSDQRHRQILPLFKVQSPTGLSTVQNSLESKEGAVLKENQVTLVVHKLPNQSVNASLPELPVHYVHSMETETNGTHIEASNDVDRKSASPLLHSCKSQDSRKRMLPSPPVVSPSPISSPAPKRSRPNSVANCTVNSSVNSAEELNDNSLAMSQRVLVEEKDSNNLYDGLNAGALVNGDGKGPTTLSETPATSMDSLIDDKSNVSFSTSVNGDETLARRVFHEASNDGVSLVPIHNRLVNGEITSNHINGLGKEVVSTLIAIRNDQTNEKGMETDGSVVDSGFSMVKAVKVPSQAVLVASPCGQVSAIETSQSVTLSSGQTVGIVNTSQSRSTASLITNSNVVQSQAPKQVCHHKQVHHIATHQHQRVCNHQANHVHIAPQQTHICPHHVHIHQHQQQPNSVQNHHHHQNHNHQHIQATKSATVPVQQHVCCHHTVQQQEQQTQQSSQAQQAPQVQQQALAQQQQSQIQQQALVQQQQPQQIQQQVQQQSQHVQQQPQVQSALVQQQQTQQPQVQQALAQQQQVQQQPQVQQALIQQQQTQQPQVQQQVLVQQQQPQQIQQQALAQQQQVQQQPQVQQVLAQQQQVQQQSLQVQQQALVQQQAQQQPQVQQQLIQQHVQPQSQQQQSQQAQQQSQVQQQPQTQQQIPQQPQTQGLIKSLGDTELSHTANGFIRVPVVAEASHVAAVAESTTPSSATIPPPSSPGTPKSSRSVASKPRRPPARKPPLVTSSADTLVVKNMQSVDGSPTPSSGTTVSTYMCEWDCCNKMFDSSTTLQKHVFCEHVPVSASGNHPPSRRYECHWVNCERVPRGLYSLQGHVQDMHLSPSALQQAQTRRQSNTVSVVRNVQTTPVRSPAIPTTVAATAISSSKDAQSKPAESTYPIDAAIQAIRRHTTVPDLLATESVPGVSSAAASLLSGVSAYPSNPALREGPVTKHLRLTAALTIRNLVTYSDKARASLRHQESQLAELALSSMESSKTICQFLYLLENADET